MIALLMSICLLAVPLPQGPLRCEEATACCRANVQKLALVYDAMSAEGAAPILKQMAESGPGKREQAAEVLARMQPRNAARLLVAMSDPVLAADLLERMSRYLPREIAPAPRPVP